MAETYIGTGTYNDVALTDEDKRKVDSLKAQYANAAAAGDTFGMEKAHAGAEEVRKPYIYSGGNDGSEYNPLAEQPKTKADVYHADVLPHATAQDAYINAMYDNQQKSSLKALESAYDQNVIDINAAAAKIPEEYQSARNKSAASYEVGRANFNEYAAGSGINTGAGSQARLAMNNQQQGDQSAINQAEATALANVETQRLKIKTQYQNDIAQAITDGDLARAQALYAEHQRVDDSIVATAMNQAQLNLSAASLNDNRQQYAQNLALSQQQYADSMAQQQFENELALAKYYASLGGGSGGSGSGGSGGSGESNDTPAQDYNGLFTAALESGHPQSFLAQKDNYSKFGFNSSSGLWDDYQKWESSSGKEPVEISGNYSMNTKNVNVDADAFNQAQYSLAKGTSPQEVIAYLTANILDDNALAAALVALGNKFLNFNTYLRQSGLYQ